MELLAGLTETSPRAVGEQVVRACAGLTGEARRLHRVGFDHDDWEAARRALASVPELRQLLEQLVSSGRARWGHGLLLLHVCGFARYAWERSDRPGGDAFWPLAAAAAGLDEPEDAEVVARAFIDSARAAGLDRAREGHYRVHTAFRNAGWSRALLGELISRLADDDPELSGCSARLAATLDAVDEPQRQRLIRLATALARLLQDDAGAREPALDICRQLVALGLDENPELLLDRIESALWGTDQPWQLGLQVVSGKPSHRLVLWHPFEGFAQDDVRQLVGGAGGVCSVPPTRGLRYLAVPQAWGEPASVTVAAGEPAGRELGRRAWPGDVLCFAPTEHSHLLQYEQRLTPQTNVLVTAEGSRVRTGSGPLPRPEPLRGGGGLVWQLPPQSRLPLVVEDDQGQPRAVLDHGQRSVVLHVAPAAPRSRGPLQGPVCVELPRVSSTLSELSLRLEPAGPSTLERAAEVTLRPQDPLERVPLPRLLPEAREALGQLRLVASSAGKPVASRQFHRVAPVVSGRPRHGEQRPRVWNPKSGQWHELKPDGEGHAVLELELEHGPVWLSWPFRPRRVEFVGRVGLQRGDPTFPRWTVDRLAAAARRGSVDEGLHICAPPGSRFRWSLLGCSCEWWRLGRHGRADIPAGMIHDWLESSVPAYRERLAQQRFAEPLVVELDAGDGTAPQEHRPLGLWGRSAPDDAELQIQDDALQVTLCGVPPEWLDVLETQPRAHFLVMPHGLPLAPAQRVEASVAVDADRVTVRAEQPLALRRPSSVRTRLAGWPRRFALHARADGTRMGIEQAFLDQLGDFAGRRWSRQSLQRVLHDPELDNASKVQRCIDLTAEAAQGRGDWPPPGALPWLADEVGEEPYMASPLPMLLARTSPGEVLRVAVEAADGGELPADEVVQWLCDLKLSPWMLGRKDLAHLPRPPLDALLEQLVASPVRDMVSDGWYRPMLLRRLAHGAPDRGAVLHELFPLLQRLGLPLMHFQHIAAADHGPTCADAAPWPAPRELARIKDDPRPAGPDRPFAQLWCEVQRVRRERGRPPRLFAGFRPGRVPRPPRHVERDETLREAGQLAAVVAALGVHWSTRPGPPPARERDALRDAVEIGPAFFAATVLASDLLGAAGGQR